MKDIFLNLMFNIFKTLYEFYNDSPFLPKWIKIGKVEKLVANLHYKTEYLIRIKQFKTRMKS